MTHSGRARRLAAATLCFAAALSGCGKADDPSVIYGHWRAENFRLGGMALPIAPEIDISADALTAHGIDARVPILRMHRDGDDVTLTLPIGLNLVFKLDGANRMSTDVPLVGPLVYRRAAISVDSAASRPATPGLQASEPTRTAQP